MRQARFLSAGSEYQLKKLDTRHRRYFDHSWLSETCVVGICSDLPNEEDWYRTSVRLLDLETHKSRLLYRSERPMEWLASSPSGSSIAFASGIASDRGMLKGDLVVLDISSDLSQVVDTNDINIGGPVHFINDHNIVATGSHYEDD